MNSLWKALILNLVLFGSAYASIETYEFENEADRARYKTLTEEIRCPKCQNQNIADSNAPIAVDLRAEVYRLVEDGQSNDEIVTYLVDRYGDFVRYRPAINKQTYILWYGPAALLIIGFLTIGVVVWRRKRNTALLSAGQKTQLTAEEQARLNALLAQQNQGKNDL
ncbi:cytochrome c-type biogenesis protein [Pseudomonas sp. F1_0610]|uniref:cytochrome c-type biogenesis protein n=1 Tax=Pseudomonas sp. F1_0610 TaxID=3114284 RepID=UPI0039C3B1EF